MKNGFIQKIQPDPALRDYIRQYTFVDFPFEQTKQMDFKVMPSSHTRMILFFSEPSLHEFKNTLQPVDRYSLTGLTSKTHLFLPTSTLQQVMIHFTEWGIQPFVDFPISDITDTRADLRYVFRQDLEEICGDLHLGSVLEKKYRLDAFFKSRLQKARQMDDRAKSVAQYILQTHGALRLQDLSKNLFIGERSAQRLIHNAVGVNYKFFAKIVRLEHVRKLMAHGDISLTDVALRAGYFDQAHFIHDFQNAFGENPGAYLIKQQNMVWNHIESR